MERLTNKITNRQTGEVLAYGLESGNKAIKAYRKLGQYEDAEEQGLLHIAKIPNGTPIYVLLEEEGRQFMAHESYLYGVTEYFYGELGKDFFTSEEECKKHAKTLYKRKE